jgi:hypothetical protein
MKNHDNSRRQVLLCTAGAFGVALHALEPMASAAAQQAPGRFRYHDIHATLEPAVGPRAFAALLAAWGPCTCPSARVRRDAELGTALSCLGFDCFGSFRDWYLEALPAQRCGACSLLMQVLYGGDS